MRYAIYYIPPPDSLLYVRGCALLGHDCYAGPLDPPAPAQPQTPGLLPGLAPEDIAANVREARMYGFHATFKPPFRLRAGRTEAELRQAFAAYCSATPPASAGRLRIAGPGPFVALEPEATSMSLQLLAAETVAWFDHFRAPPDAADLKKRPPETLTPRQRALQQRWGYPYVFDAFRFHMTLSDRLAPEPLKHWRQAMAAWFGTVEVVVDALALVRQDHRDAPFRVLDRRLLNAGQAVDTP